MTVLKTDQIRPNARKAAYLGLLDIFEKEAYANLTVLRMLRRYKFSPEDSRFFTELVYGVCRRYNLLLWIMEQSASRSTERMDVKVRLLLALGLYQLLFLDSVPDSAAVNETVRIAKSVTHAGNVRFVNAVLRGYLRKKKEIQIPAETEDPILHLSLFYNEPEWLVRRWGKNWGLEKTRQILSAFNKIVKTDIRCNTLKTSCASLYERLQEAGAKPALIPYIPEGIEIGNGSAFFRGDFLKEGAAYVQNRSSMIPAQILAPRPGEKVLDMCSAPGSKTTQMAALMKNQGRIDAWDIHPHKISLIQENCQRLGISIVHATVQDSTQKVARAAEAYDRVLLDAPCSGLGVIGRKMEMRWRRNEEALSVFPPLQKTLLARAADYVAPGGILVYSTCTLERAENEDNIQHFLALHPEFEPLPFSFDGRTVENGMLTIWPDLYGSDGFFAAALRKRT